MQLTSDRGAVCVLLAPALGCGSTARAASTGASAAASAEWKHFGAAFAVTDSVPASVVL